MTTPSIRSVTTVIPSTTQAREVLEEAAAAFGEGGIALVASPRSYVMLRSSGSGWVEGFGVAHIDDSARFDDAFEVRVFDAQREWRWRYSSAGSAVHELRESEHSTGSLSAGDREVGVDDSGVEPATVLDAAGYSRRVLGRPTGMVSDDRCWVRTAEGSIGAIDVPLTAAVPSGAELSAGWLEVTALEYVGMNESGSMFVVGERLTGIRFTTATERADR